jgi:transglutaminase superfamily protein
MTIPPETAGNIAMAAHTQQSRGGRRSYRARGRLALEILAAYVQSRRALRRAPIDEVVAELRSQPPSVAPFVTDTLQEAHSLGWAVARLLAHVPGDTRCLVRSLVLTRLLASRGVTSKLVIGTQSSPEFLAHAWVEHDGTPVLDPGGETFGRLVEL